MKKAARWALTVVALQGTLIGAYWQIERDRQPTSSAALRTDPPERISQRSPKITVRAKDGSARAVASGAKPTLVHVWATWCPPCRSELPGLLSLPERFEVDVMAIALDRDWTEVERFLGDLSTADVYLGDAREVQAALGVGNLPVTFLVQPSGLMTLRFEGAQDWANSNYVGSWSSF